MQIYPLDYVNVDDCSILNNLARQLSHCNSSKKTKQQKTHHHTPKTQATPRNEFRLTTASPLNLCCFEQGGHWGCFCRLTYGQLRLSRTYQTVSNIFFHLHYCSRGINLSSHSWNVSLCKLSHCILISKASGKAKLFLPYFESCEETEESIRGQSILGEKS